MASKKRALLIKTAGKLFYTHGFHAIGIDTLIEEAGIAKMTLYNHFASKEDLITSVVKDKSRKVIQWIRTGVEEKATSPQGRLLSVFDLHELWFQESDFRGCFFNKAAAEFPDKDHPVHQAVSEHFALLFNYFSTLSHKARVNTPNTLAEEMVLMLEGATALAFTTGATIAARRAKRSIQNLM